MAPESAPTFRVRTAGPDDDAAWARLRSGLWPDCPIERHAVEREIYLRSPGIIALAVDAKDRACGFAEISIRRDHVTGTSTASVPFLEGWYVEPAWRHRGVGRALIDFAISWAREQGYQELASDVELDNQLSQQAHQRLGFVETERTINYLLKFDE